MRTWLQRAAINEEFSMGRISGTFAVVLMLLATGASAQPGAQWVEGKNYFLIQPAQPTDVAPGKIEVTEVFSYACPACFQFYTVADRLKAALPPNAQMDYVPASYNPTEDWPVFQRAYYTALTLGVAEKTHDAMFNAIWSSGELAVVDPRTHQLRRPLPSIEDAAQFYSRAQGIPPEKFIGTANSMGVQVKINRANKLVIAYGADSTPTMVVNGKYRLTVQSAGGYDQTIALVKYLVARESK
jgi:thiol:disulfide interchange protein DsbA